MPPSNADIAKLLTGPGAPFEIAEADVLGRRLRVWKNAMPSLRALLDISRLHGDKAFLVYEDERFTFEEHWRAAAAVGRVLVERFGVAKGDRVAIAMRNFPEWPMAFFGATAVGAVAVPLNAWWTGEELEYGLRDSGACVLFCDAERATRVAPHLEALPDLRHVVVVRPDDEPIPPEHHSLRGARRAPREGRDAPGRRDRAGRRRDDLLHLRHDGEAEGRPRHPPQHLRQRRLPRLRVACARCSGAARSRRTRRRRGPRRRSYLSVPLFHATGCHAVLCGNVAFGGKLVMMFKWDPARALALIEREKITSFGGVPAMVWQVLEHPDFETRDLSSVQSVGYGGAPAAPELVRRIREAFPKSSPGQRLRPDRDLLGDDPDRRRRLRRPPGQRRRARPGRRHPDLRRPGGTCRSAKSARCGSAARTW